MHGVPRNAKQSAAEQSENEKKGKMGLLALEECLKASQNLDDDTFGDFMERSSTLLVRFPDVPALWHTRRRVITNTVTKDLLAQPSVFLVQMEIFLTKEALRKSKKCAPAWTQRQFAICLICLVASEDDLDNIGWTFNKEMTDLDSLLDLDDRNFHIWAHYRFLTDLRNLLLEGLDTKKENLHSIIRQIISKNSVFFPFIKSLPRPFNNTDSPYIASRSEFATSRLKKSVSNGSAWHHRDFGRIGCHTDAEDEFITDAIYTVAEDQGVWSYFEKYQLSEGHYPAVLLHAYVCEKSQKLFMRFDRPLILYDDEERMKGNSPQLSRFKTLWERNVDVNDVLSSKTLKLYITTVKQSTTISVAFQKLYKLGESTTHLRAQIGDTLFSIEGPMMSRQRYLTLETELRSLLDCLHGEERRFVIRVSCLLERRMAWSGLGGTPTTNWDFLIASYDTLVEIDSIRKGLYLEQQTKTKTIRRLMSFLSNPELRNLEELKLEVKSTLGENFGDLLYFDE